MAMNPRPTFNPDHVTMQDSRTGEIPSTISNEILTEVKHGSGFMKLAKAEPMTTQIHHFSRLLGVGAYWVNETERIQTSKPEWIDFKMTAHKLGVIIPVSKETLQYSVSNFFELMRPEVAEAFAIKFDEAMFMNINNPYPNSIVQATDSTGNKVTETTNKYDDISSAMGMIERAGVRANAIASNMAQFYKYRGTKDAAGLPIFNAATEREPDRLVGLPVVELPQLLGNESNIGELVGNWNFAHYGILQGISYEILTEATLTTIVASDGNPVNLAERDMVALKATMQVGAMITKDEAFAVIETEPAP